MVSIRVRGIYSLPFAKLFHNKGHEIVQPTKEIKRYLDIQDTNAPPDVTVGRGNNRHESLISGDQESMELVLDIVTEEFLDIVVKRFDYSLNSIYYGAVVNVDTDRRAAFVDLGPTDGFLPFRNTDRRLREGDEITVKTIELPTNPDENPVLTTDITYANDYTVLLNEGVKISNKIREKEERDRLEELGKQVETDRGILWRTSARGMKKEFLRQQVEDLINEANKVEKRASRTVAPDKLKEGSTTSTLLIPGFTKEKLDKIRSKVAPTVTKHHKYKAADSRHDLAVETVEKITEDEEILKKFDSVMKEIELIEIGDSLKITPLKPDGSSLDYGRGRVIQIKNDEVELKRRINRKEFREIPINDADYAVTSVEEGSWMTVTEFFTKNEEHVGMFVNINTPIELYPWEVRYIDLCVDLVVKEKDVEIIDKGELDEHVAEGRISQELAERAIEAAENVQDELAY